MKQVGMNILFLTQSRSLAVFYDVMSCLKESGRMSGAGFYIADSSFYNTFKKKRPDIDSGEYVLLKEWDILKQSAKCSPDIGLLKEYEERYGDPVLWNALLADRRIYLGESTTIEQDYRSRFSHESMLAILQISINQIEELFDYVRPDVVCGFICVTIGEYLAYLIARERNIPFFNLRPTRIKNYFYAGESVHEPSPALENTYGTLLNGGITEDVKQEASQYIQGVLDTHAMYEGVTPTGGVVSKSGPGMFSKSISVAMSIGTRVKRYCDYNIGELQHDNHYINDIRDIYIKRIKKPVRIKYTDYSIRNQYIGEHELGSTRYAFYPLHKEPEVTLLVYGRSFMNQIEVIRNIARSLPVGMKLIAKEHPASKGYRPLSYYKKILDIPNVLLSASEMQSRVLVQNAELVTIISGSVGLEALMMKKPVLHFGNVPFSMLPDSMIRHATQPDNLATEINDLLSNYFYNEKSMIAYISAVMKMSVPVNFYTVLLGRSGVYAPDSNATYNEEIKRLADYLKNCLENRNN